VFDPDPASRSGVSVRTIGYSASLGGLVTVITVEEEDETIFGINAWPSNPTDERRYRERPAMSNKLQQALAEADEIEAAEHATDTDAPLPAHVKVSQPGRARSKVLQVRLNPDELAALEHIAQRRKLPVSTVARAQLLRLIADETAPTDRLLQLIEAANQVRSLADDVRKDLRGRASH
jgi:hypothetical protein